MTAHVHHQETVALMLGLHVAPVATGGALTLKDHLLMASLGVISCMF
ncbi:hypothetical protein ACP4OV_030412 [Aristida adscensionis]